MGSTARFCALQTLLCSIIQIPKAISRRALSWCTVSEVVGLPWKAGKLVCVPPPHKMSPLQNQLQTAKSKLLCIYATEPVGMQGGDKGSPVLGCWRLPHGYQVEHTLHQLQCFILVQQTQIKHWTLACRRTVCVCGRVLLSTLCVVTYDGCMSESQGTNALAQIAQRSCGCPTPGGTRGQEGWGRGKPELAEGDPVHGREGGGGWTWWSLSCLPPQNILGEQIFYGTESSESKLK